MYLRAIQFSFFKCKHKHEHDVCSFEKVALAIVLQTSVVGQLVQQILVHSSVGVRCIEHMENTSTKHY